MGGGEGTKVERIHFYTHTMVFLHVNGTCIFHLTSSQLPWETVQKAILTPLMKVSPVPGWATGIVSDRIGRAQVTCLLPPFLFSLLILLHASTLSNLYGV